MKHIALTTMVLFYINSSIACSCSSAQSFCNTHTGYDISASCVVIDAFPHGISLKILHILHGTESRDTIKVWDLGGPYSTCNDSLTDASAAYLGAIGDTLILALPKIDTAINTWDVIGDYRTPGFQCGVYKLTVVNSTVLGFISGPSFCFNFNNCLTSYNYNDFLIDFPVNSLNCQTWLNTSDLIPQEYFYCYPNPSIEEVILTTSQNGVLTITNYYGQFVDVVNITSNHTQLSTELLPGGIYFLTFQNGKSVQTKKLIVQH